MAVQPVAHRFTVDDYYRMADAGILGADERVELLQGEIIEMAPIGSHHAACVRQLSRLFHQQLGGRAIVSVQDPVRLDDLSEPQPDVALLRPRPDDYAGAHPTPGDVLLLVEVGDTTAAWDARHKLPLYAAAGVGEVWLVNLVAGAVEVCLRPEGGAYTDRRSFGPEAGVAPEAFPDVVIDVGDLLPPA